MPAVSRQILERDPPRERSRRSIDAPATMMILMLVAIGLIALFTASYPSAMHLHGDPLHFVSRQAIFAVAGIGAMWFVSGINYHLYAKAQKPILMISFFLLFIVKFIGQTRNGAKRWIGIGEVITFQPSEVMKIALIISFAFYIAKHPESVRSIKGLMWPYGAILLATAGLLFLQKHLSATIIIFCIGFVMLFVGGAKLWYFIFLIGLGIAGAVGYISVKPYAMDRIRVWIDPWVDFLGDGWQGAMSAISIGSGGLWGLGLGQGRQKHLYLPEPQNDFVFSAFCEELGWVGAVLVMLMFAYLVFRGLYIARCARDRFGCLLATGITAKFAIQTLMNLFVISGILPVTGASLPFFSSGGTALLMQLFEMGVLLNVSKYMQPGSS